MKKILLVGCIGFPLLLVVVTAIAIMTMSGEYDVQESVTVDATPDKIYPMVASLNRWPEWTVWTKEKYPDIETTYSGAEIGVGSRSEWTDTSGNGWMEVTKADPQTGIEYTMQFGNFPEAKGAVTFVPGEGGTTVTMSLKGEVTFPWKVMRPVMESGMSQEFGENMQKLKAAVEGQ